MKLCAKWSQNIDLSIRNPPFPSRVEGVRQKENHNVESVLIGCGIKPLTLSGNCNHRILCALGIKEINPPGIAETAIKNPKMLT